jgi:hypothetical protein
MKDNETIVILVDHAVDIKTVDGKIRKIPPSGQVARAEKKNMPFKVFSNILINAPCWTIVNLPEPKKNTLYVVSRMVKNLVPWRYDVVCPGEPITNTKKERIGADGFLL